MSSPHALPIRRAVTADQSGVAGCAVAAYAAYERRIGIRPAPMDADYRALIAKAEVWVVDAGEGIVGILVLERGSDHVLVDNVAVHPDAQGQGVGRRLLAYAEQRARECGKQCVKLFTNAAMTENIELYRRLGYIQEDRRVEAGYDRVFMYKPV